MIGAAAAVGAVVVAITPVGQTIEDTAFGLHVNGIAQSAPAQGVLSWCGCGMRGCWDEVEPARDQYRWGPSTRRWPTPKAAGATDILYVLGSTPQWAARKPQEPGL